MGRWILAFIVVGLLAGGGDDLRGFFHSIDSTQNISLSGSSAEEQASCKTVQRVIRVYLNPTEYPNVVAHWRRAVRAGQPVVWHLDSANAFQNHLDNLEGQPTKEGYDLDEVPPAATTEGADGAADLAYVPSSENKAAGLAMQNQLNAYCDGQVFRVVTQP